MNSKDKSARHSRRRHAKRTSLPPFSEGQTYTYLGTAATGGASQDDKQLTRSRRRWRRWRGREGRAGGRRSSLLVSHNTSPGFNNSPFIQRGIMMVEHLTVYTAHEASCVRTAYAQHDSIVFNRKEGADLVLSHTYVETDFYTDGKIRNQTKNIKNKVI